VEVEIELSNDVLLKLALLAHENDITLNEMCNKLLKDYIELKKKENPNDNKSRC